MVPNLSDNRARHVNPHRWTQNSRLLSLFRDIKILGISLARLTARNISSTTKKLMQMSFILYMNSVFERELALLVALQGESSWKGGGSSGNS